MKYYFFTILFLAFNFLVKAQDVDQMRFRSLVNLSNYIANDYVNAVENGEVINEFEYEEMLEFADQLQEIHLELNESLEDTNFPYLDKLIHSIKLKITEKAHPKQIRILANSLSEDLLSLGILSSFPSTYPNIENGKLLYATNCAYCHGDKGLGDGLSSKGLNPAPSNFQESQHVFPFHIYNTVQLGIEGTSMAPQPHLSETETWDLAFYVMTLTYKDSLIDADLQNNALSQVDLSILANKNNAAIENLFDANAFEKVKALRFYNGPSSRDASLDLTLQMLQQSIATYKEGYFSEANQKALNAYFIGFEPVEISLGATNPGKVSLIEKEMIVFRSFLNESGNDTSLEEQYEKIAYHFDVIKNEKEESGFWFTFFASVSILIREGLEALFIIVAILAALNSFAAGEKAKKFVHTGWISALVIGVASYFFAGKLIAMGAHKRELIEGFGALLAVVILLSVGFWLHDKSNVKSWTKYVNEKLSKHLNANSLWSVAVLAFVVVFREAFESVIFLSSLSMSGGEESGLAVLTGTIFSALVIIAIGVAIIRFSKRLPVHKVFKISSITMLVLAVILAGKGIKELQEAALVGVDLMPFRTSIDLLGFYPTMQTIGAQVLTIIIAAGLWFWNKRKV